MEGNDVCKIFIVVAFAADMLAGGYISFASFSDRLAPDASVKADRHHGGSLFPVYQSLIHAPRQSSWRLNLGDIPKNRPQ
jgi:hypothetical protein